MLFKNNGIYPNSKLPNTKKASLTCKSQMLRHEIYIKLTWYKTNFSQKIKGNLISHVLTPLNSNFNVKEHQTWMQTLPINALQHTLLSYKQLPSCGSFVVQTLRGCPLLAHEKTAVRFQ